MKNIPSESTGAAGGIEPSYSEDIQNLFDSFCLEGKITEQHAREIKNILSRLISEK